MPRIHYTNRYFSGKTTLENIPENKLNGIVLECYRILHMNRYNARMVKVNVKKELEVYAKLQFAINTLLKLGFTTQVISVKKGTTFWRKLRQYPKNGTLAILGCSHKYMIKKAVKKVVYKPPTVNGTLKYTEPFSPYIYISGSEWVLGCTSGNPYIISSPDFEVWDEPFHSNVD